MQPVISQLEDKKFENIVNQIRIYMENNNIISSRVFKLHGKYKSLSEETLIALTKSLEIYLEYIQKTIEISKEEGLWRIFNALGITPHSDFLNLESKSYVQFFDKNGLLLFQTFDLYEYITYSYEDLIMHPWSSLFERDPKITEYLEEQAKKAITSGRPVAINSGFHLVKQIHSEEGISILLNVINGYPLYERGTKNVMGYVAQYEVKLADN